MNRFKELKVWQKSMQLCKEVYSITKEMPKTELYGLISQLNRAVVSIPSNIAEGSSRDSNKEFAYFLSIAQGSVYEVETQLILIQNIKLVKKEKVEISLSLVTEIQKMLFVLKQKLKSNV